MEVRATGMARRPYVPASAVLDLHSQAHDGVAMAVPCARVAQGAPGWCSGAPDGCFASL